jgi:hypothetical protein
VQIGDQNRQSLVFIADCHQVNRLTASREADILAENRRF